MRGEDERVRVLKEKFGLDDKQTTVVDADLEKDRNASKRQDACEK